MEGVLILLLLILGVIFVLPIVSIVRANGAVERARRLEERLDRTEHELAWTRHQLAMLRRELESRLASGPIEAPPAPAAAPSSVDEVVSAARAVARTPTRVEAESVELAPLQAAASEQVVPNPVSTPPEAVREQARAERGPGAEDSSRANLEASAERPRAESAPEGQAASAPSGEPGSAREADQAGPKGAAPRAAEPSPGGSARGAAPSSEAPPSEPFDWERWLGVRGAAVLGGVVLALAGFLFFRYAIDHALISPTLRVVLGTFVGVAALVLGERLHNRYGITANALGGGGMVVLYATFWAARTLYHLIGTEVAFGLMALTTTVGCLLAVRSHSLLIAVLGLVGGFLTPLLLSTGEDRPIGLFGYILLLDTGFILAARKRGWSLVFALSLLGTLLLEALWITERMGSERIVLGLLIVALFVAVFALAGFKPPEEKRAPWLMTQAAGLLLPFGFALYFASYADVGKHLWPVALLLSLLVAGAGFVARANESTGFLPVASAVASVTVFAVWLSGAPYSPSLAWEAVACGVGLAAVFQLLAELERTPGRVGPSGRAAIVAEVGLFFCLIVGASSATAAQFGGWLCGFVGLALLLVLHGRLQGRPGLAPAAAVLLALSLIVFQRSHAGTDALPDLSAYLATEVAFAFAFQVLSLVDRKPAQHLAAALYPGLLLLGALAQRAPLSPSSPALALGPSLILGALSLFAATRAKDGRWFPPTAVALLVAQNAALVGMQLESGPAQVALAIQFASALFVMGWSALVKARLEYSHWALYVSALAGPAWFLSLRSLYLSAFGAGTIGVLPVLLGACSLAALSFCARGQTLLPELRRSALVWHAAVALGFASAAIPLQLDRQWITIGWALEAAAVLFLYRRLDHAGLKWFSLALALAVSIRLLANPAVLGYQSRGGPPFFNWLLYTYWVPALALLAGYYLLRDLELSRVRSWEQALYKGGLALGATGLFVAVIAIVFAWLNLAIVDAFSEGAELTLDLQRRPARDLTISLSWLGYGGALLALGMVKGSRGLRWLSLIFLILSIGKVFLYDLGELRDLYRVLSLLGLALSLICVSLAYQRFVFGSEREPRNT
ncbi:MAG TPA: DUF2339 domain-containing protein [Polyangiaceae bacterium]|nr:DUF2339 domain-containing protein [Polyangiaceae bacterium]